MAVVTNVRAVVAAVVAVRAVARLRLDPERAKRARGSSKELVPPRGRAVGAPCAWRVCRSFATLPSCHPVGAPWAPRALWILLRLVFLLVLPGVLMTVLLLMPVVIVVVLLLVPPLLRVLLVLLLRVLLVFC